MSMRTREGKKISLTNYEELLAVPTIEGASDIPLDQLHEFKGHPFHVVDDEAMDELVESIKATSVDEALNELPLEMKSKLSVLFGAMINQIKEQDVIN